MPIRKNNLPGKYSDEEMADIQRRATDAGLSTAAWIRNRLNQKPISMGAPKENKNASKKSE